jgi:hypothetical protein
LLAAGHCILESLLFEVFEGSVFGIKVEQGRKRKSQKKKKEKKEKNRKKKRKKKRAL